MTRHESKLLSRWPDYRRRGKVMFLFSHGIAPFTAGVLLGALAYHLFSGHSMHWGGITFMVAVTTTVGCVRAATLWNKIESAYNQRTT